MKRTEQKMEASVLELLEIDLSIDVPAKTCPICGSNVESK